MAAIRNKGLANGAQRGFCLQAKASFKNIEGMLAKLGINKE